MRKLIVTIAAAIAVATVPMAADAAPCKDAKGKFIKCPPAAAAKPAVASAKPAAKPVAAKPAAGAKKAPCRDAKGRFTKCK